MVCHSLLQWTTFCQISPPWPICLGWPQMAWLNFIELDKSVVPVIRLTSFLWVWFVCLPSDASRNTYHRTWVSLTMGYPSTAAPAKYSRCSLPWMRGISSQPPPDLECGVAPLSPPVPTQPLLLGRGVAPLGHRPDVGCGVAPLYALYVIIYRELIIEIQILYW